MVFQDYALFPHLTVADNIAFGLSAMDKTAKSERVAEMLVLIGMSEYANYYPHELSGDNSNGLHWCVHLPHARV